MDNLTFMLMSTTMLIAFTTMATANPDQVSEFTGLDFKSIDRVDPESIGLSQTEFSEASCSPIQYLQSEDVVFGDNISKSVNASSGWFTVDTRDMDTLIVDATERDFFLTKAWISAYNYNTSGALAPVELLGEISGENNRINLKDSRYVDQITEVNFTINYQDAVITDITNECIQSKEKGKNPESSNSYFPGLISAFQGFTSKIIGLFSFQINVLNTFFSLLSITGNEVSVTIVKSFLGLNIIGWIYVAVDMISQYIDVGDFIPFT